MALNVAMDGVSFPHRHEPANGLMAEGNQMADKVYLGDWSDKADMLKSFHYYGESVVDLTEGYEVLLAYYDECYEGSAFVLLSKDGELYEVNGGHCSCYGLEGQWDVEHTTPEALLHRLDKGYSFGTSYSDNTFAAELRAILAGASQ